MHRVLMIGITMLICGCVQKPGLQKVHDERTTLGTFVQIDVCASSENASTARAVLKQVWQKMDRFNADLNVYDNTGALSRLNRAGGEWTAVPPDLYDILRFSFRMTDETGGAFDITVRPLIQLWRAAAEKGKMPREKEIQKALALTGTGRVLEMGPDSRVRIVNPGASFDLGGVAKGYAVDQAAQIIRGEGFSNFFIDAGGDIYAAGTNCRLKPWRIGVRHPRRADKLIAVLEVSDQAVATSGDYEQFYEIGGRVWSHVIDPRSGFPVERVEGTVISATAVAPTAMEADALATALTVWPAEQGLSFLEDRGFAHQGLLVIETDSGVRLRESGGL